LDIALPNNIPTISRENSSSIILIINLISNDDHYHFNFSSDPTKCSIKSEGEDEFKNSFIERVSTHDESW
jgi:hypothetical protein